MSAYPESITTPRLRLRLPEPAADARPMLANWASDPEVTRYVLWAAYDPAAPDVAERFLEDVVLANWREDVGHRAWMITRDSQTIGMIGVTPRGPNTVEVGYVLGRAFWGQGLMTEALGAVVATLFERPHVWRVCATAHVANVASHRVLEKAGLTYEGTLRRHTVYANLGPEPQDNVMYARVRDA